MKLTVEQIEPLRGLINIGIAQAAEILNEMIPSQVHLQVPLVQPVGSGDEVESLGAHGVNQNVTVNLGFTGALSGNGILALPIESASKLTSALTDESANTPGFDGLREEAITEVGNIVINGVMGSIANSVQQTVDYAVPSYAEGVNGQATFEKMTSGATNLMAKTHFTVEQLEIEGEIVLSFATSSLDALLEIIKMVPAD